MYITVRTHEDHGLRGVRDRARLPNVDTPYVQRGLLARCSPLRDPAFGARRGRDARRATYPHTWLARPSMADAGGRGTAVSHDRERSGPAGSTGVAATVARAWQPDPRFVHDQFPG